MRDIKDLRTGKKYETRAFDIKSVEEPMHTMDIKSHENKTELTDMNTKSSTWQALDKIWDVVCIYL